MTPAVANTAAGSKGAIAQTAKRGFQLDWAALTAVYSVNS